MRIGASTLRRAALLAVSAALLVWLWRRAGGAAVADVLAGLDPAWLAAALAMFVPTTALTAWRWQRVASVVRALGFAEALRMVLAASTANVFLPAKLGDVAKGALVGDGPDGRAGGVAVAVFEKLADVAALAAWMVVACAWAPPADEAEQLAYVLGLGAVAAFGVLCVVPVGGGLVRRESGPVAGALRGLALLRARPRRLAVLLVASLALWGLHLLQFLFAAWAAGAEATPALLASRIPMAIFVGLLPVSFAGIGTRDAALVYLLGDAVGAPVALALGAFATLRYLVPAAAGALVLDRVGASRTEGRASRVDRRASSDS